MHTLGRICSRCPLLTRAWASLYTITPAIARLLNFLNEKAVLNGKNMLVLLRYETWLMTGLTLSSICMKIGWIWMLFVSVSMDITDMHRLMPQGTVPDLPLISIPWRHWCMEGNYSKCTLLGECITLIVLCVCMRKRWMLVSYVHKRPGYCSLYSIYCTI